MCSYEASLIHFNAKLMECAVIRWANIALEDLMLMVITTTEVTYMTIVL